MTSAHRSERGEAAVYVVLLIPAMIIMAGLVVDGSVKNFAAQHAQVTASAAARAGTDASAKQSLGGKSGTAAAAAAARSYLTQSGVTGSVQVTGGGVVSIDTSETSSTHFLSLIGINTVTGRGHAESTLEPTR